MYAHKGTFSVSQVESFLKCPYAYHLSYNEKIPWPGVDRMDHGKRVHEALEQYPVRSKEFGEFSDQLAVFLGRESLEIATHEKTVNISLFGKPFTGRIDAVCTNGTILDFKITTAPSYYKAKLGYQLPFYLYAMYGESFSNEAMYVLFKITSSGKFDSLDFFKLSSVCTPSLFLGSLHALAGGAELIETAYRTGRFPPSYNNCYTCPYKNSCKYYNSKKEC